MTVVPWDPTFERAVRAALPYLEPGEELLPTTSLSDCGLDSMGMIQLVGQLEQACHVSFPPGTMPTSAFATAGTLWGMLQAARAQQEVGRETGGGARRYGGAGAGAAVPGRGSQPWVV